MTRQRQNAQRDSLLMSRFQPRFDLGRSFHTMCSLHLMLPGLRGFWPMGSFDATPDLYDISGQVRHLTLAGNPQFALDGIIPYWQFDGTGDYFARTDEAGLSVTGTEAYVETAEQGLTFGAWVYFDNAASTIETVLSKWFVTGNLRSFRLFRQATGEIRCEISDDGTNTDTATTTATVGNGEWVHVAGRFDPSSNIHVTLNGADTAEATALASINDNASDWRLGANGGGTELLTGRIALPFLCASFIPTSLVQFIYHEGRALFNRV